MKVQGPGTDGDCARGWGPLAVCAAAAACLSVMVWMGLGWDALRSRESYAGRKLDYYSSQVHGFISGHLYMDREAEPGRASPDPAVRAKTPFLLDASYYKGRYYLYFGVTPAALILLPYAWLTGGDLDPRLIVVLCSALGFLFSMGILTMAARDHFDRPGGWFLAAASLVLAFATAVPLLLARAMFYEVAIAAGYACTLAGAFWTYRAVSGRGGVCLQLALASLSLGLAVGCRPDLVLNVPVLAAAAIVIAWRGREGTPWRRTALRAGAAAVIPAAFVGALLAIYNYERFGNPAEFGMTYSLNNFMASHTRLVSAAYLWPNVHWYYLTFPALSPFFPYVFPEAAFFGPPEYRGGEVIHGQFPVFVLAAFVAVSAILLWKRLRIGRLAAYLCLVAWMFLAPFLAMSAIGVRADRYMVDFQPPLALAIVLLAGAIVSLPWKGTPSRLWRGAFAVLAVLAAAFNVFAGLQAFEAFKDIRIPTYRALESLGNLPAYWLTRMGALEAGPIELRVVFPTNLKLASIEPLLTVGTPERTDSLYVIEWAGGQQIELQGDHSGYGGPSSDVITITPGQVYTLTVDMGSLYPPISPPFIADYKARHARLLKTEIRVEMDGKAVLNRKMDSYDAPPWAVRPGRNGLTMNLFRPEFSGLILSARRLPPPVFMENNGLWRIRCVFPLDHPGRNFPLLSSGVAGSGTLVYLNVLAGNQVRFGVDEWNLGGGLSDSFMVSPQSEHVVEIFVGPLAKGATWPGDWGVSLEHLGRFEHDIKVWLDGRLVWTAGLRRPLDPSGSLNQVGTNRQGFSTADGDYSGPIQSEPFVPWEAREFLGKNLKGKQ
jgi:hypothetical protein